LPIGWAKAMASKEICGERFLSRAETNERSYRDGKPMAAKWTDPSGLESVALARRDAK
jgi:hypothetical protein